MQITIRDTRDADKKNEKRIYNKEINNFENKRYEKSELMRSDAAIESYIKTTANFDNAINDIKKILVLVLEQELKDADKDSNTIIEEITSRRRNISNLVEETKNDIALNNSERTSVEICSSQLKYSEKHITLKIEFIL